MLLKIINAVVITIIKDKFCSGCVEMKFQSTLETGSINFAIAMPEIITISRSKSHENRCFKKGSS